MTDDVHSVFDFPSSLIGTRSKHTRNNLLTFQRSEGRKFDRNRIFFADFLLPPFAPHARGCVH